MGYSSQEIADMYLIFRTLHSREEQLLLDYFRHGYLLERSKEYAMQGFIRRLGSMKLAISNVFTLLPPGDETIPSDTDRHNAEINVHANILHAYGSVDNLARIWAYESGLKNASRPIPDSWVGLGPKNIKIRKSLSLGFQQALKELDDWFKYLENYRHALDGLSR
jgi:hypothetical protein